jgi:N-[(2S)-2-amino-2-carboxyethyl]-L-glutamate dehydrogenase
MTELRPEPPSGEAMRLLTRGQVRAALERVDPVAVIEDTLRAHARAQTTVPPEAYLPWQNSQDAYCRSLAMPGAIGHGPQGVLGLKVINAAVSNPAAGLPRAGGFTVLFDYETGRPRVLAEGAYISALRTAGYTIASLRHLGPTRFETVAFVGCGNLAHVHAELFERYFPMVRRLRLTDRRPAAAEQLARAWSARPGRTASVHGDVAEALDGAEVVVTLTTSAEPYIEPEWLDEHAFVAHVSLADLRPAVFTGAAAIFVDDLALVLDNPRRTLGALLRDGVVAPAPGRGPHVAGSLGEVLCGAVEAVRPVAGRVVSNPFGISILDLALLREVATAAEQSGAGLFVDLTADGPGGGPELTGTGARGA